MRNMKPTDEMILANLRKTVWAEMDDQTFDLVMKAVEEAGDIRDTTGYAMTLIQKAVVEKGRFASRSEAGRYAANMRWQGQGDGTQAPKGGIRWEDLRPTEITISESENFAKLEDGELDYRQDLLNRKMDTLSEEDKVIANRILRRLDQEIARRESKAQASRQRESYGLKIKTGKPSAIANVIYDDIRRQGKKVPPALEPYLDAMSSLDSVNDNYGMDSGRSIVAYALSNMGTYKGETARAAKAKLKELLKG